ncbi:hypothetical protein MSPP1_001428 [Malassezia sp. CBS 17886]|nr:hypothetical protein MSPP1_001428 [Malassezia sp. CBS 17886]
MPFNCDTVKNVVVVGGSYGGMHAAVVLARKLPPTHRVILVEQNTHFNHVYVFPRFIVFPGHEHKAFVPYTSIFSDSPQRRSKKERAPSRAANAPLGAAEMEDALLNASESVNEVYPATREVAPLRKLMEKKLHVGGTSDSQPPREERANGHHEEATPGGDGAQEERAEACSERGRASADTHVNGAAQPSDDRTRDGNADAGDGANDTPPPQMDTNGTHGAFHEDAEPHMVVCGRVESITETHVNVTRHKGNARSGGKGSLWSIDTLSIPYAYLIYALGSHMPDPLRHESHTKEEGIAWMKRFEERIRESKEIVIVGGGALGVEFATDIASLYAGAEAKRVTLIHSRKQLLPNFDPRIHEAAYKRLRELGVHVVMGQRLALAEGCPLGSSVTQEGGGKEAPGATQKVEIVGKNKPCPPAGRPQDTEKPAPELNGVSGSPADTPAGHTRYQIRTTLGETFECDLLLLCTGQQPNSSIMAQFSPGSVNPHSRLVRVMPSLQVMVPHDADALQQPFDIVPPCKDCDCFIDKKVNGSSALEEDPDHKPSFLPNVYAIGDVADAFGALNAGYQAWYMGEVAAENILRDVLRRASADDPNTALPPGEPVPRQEFVPSPNMLKLSLGKGSCAVQGAPEPDPSDPDAPPKPSVNIVDDPEDMNVELIWRAHALADTEDMYS